MKLRINTINGGGQETLMRLKNSLKQLLPELDKHDWSWTILSQGPSGTPVGVLNHIKDELKNVNFLHYPRNLGTVWATNELIDFTKQSEFDIFWMVDDDIEFKKNGFIDEMATPILEGKRKTVCDLECIFGANRKTLQQKGRFVQVGDHGSGVTMYSSEIYGPNGAGYHDEAIIQYAHDTEFNVRIKMAFGDDALSVFTGETCNHYNQQGTRKNFGGAFGFSEVMKRDGEHLKTKKYPQAFLEREFFKKPLFDSTAVVVR